MTDRSPVPPQSNGPLTRRSLLRTAAGLSLAGGLAGCNQSSSEPTTESPASASTMTQTVTRTSTPTPTPTLTAPPSPTPTGTPTATATPTPTVQSTAREIVELLIDEQFATAHDPFSATLAQSISRTTLERYWMGLTAQHRQVDGISSVENGTRDGNETVVVTVECAERSQRIEFAFTDQRRVSGLWFPAEYSSPEYVDESTFTEQTLTMEPEGCSLPATLTVPNADGPHPGVVLVHGSGSHDRDETIGPNKPFRDLAHGLATEGLAVLRYDKRTEACSVPRENWTIDRIIADDAVHALSTLREQGGIDGDATGVIGHSAGATCVPRIADRDGKVTGGVLLAGNGRPFTDVYLEQVKHVFSVQDGLSTREERQIEQLKQLMTAVENGDVTDNQRIGPLPGVWWKSLSTYDQIATANQAGVPLFVTNAGRDFQVPPEPAQTAWKDGLDDVEGHRFELYDGLSHLFHSGTTPSIQTEYVFPDNVENTVVSDAADWLTATL